MTFTARFSTFDYILYLPYKVEKAVLHQPTKFTIRRFQATYIDIDIGIDILPDVEYQYQVAIQNS